MRVGQNPAKAMSEVTKPKRITVAVLNYIPFQSGFYAEMLDVLKACLGSINSSITMPYDLLVFDNGSCGEVKEYLKQMVEDGKIQYLILSEKNLGKGGAWNIIFESAPGEIIAYSDNDVYFYPGWLEHSLEVLENYPKVGMVTSRAFRSNPEFLSTTLEWAKKTEGVVLEDGTYIPFDKFLEFNLSLGTTEESNVVSYQNTFDHRITYKNLQAMAGASHWQFVAYKSVLKHFLPFEMDKPMGQVKQLDKRMNEEGYLRLMINDFLAMNMSNSPILGKEDMLKSSKITPKKHLLLDQPLLKKILLSVYNKIFEWYYLSNK